MNQISTKQEIINALKKTNRDNNQRLAAIMCLFLIVLISIMVFIHIGTEFGFKMNLLMIILIIIIIIIPIIICSVVIYIKRDAFKNLKLIIRAMINFEIGIYIPTGYQRKKFELNGMVLPFERIKKIYFNGDMKMWTVLADNKKATTISCSFLPDKDLFISKYHHQIDFVTDQCYFWWGKGTGEGVFNIIYDVYMDENGVRLVFEKESRYLQWRDITKIWIISWSSMDTGATFYLNDGKKLRIIGLASYKKNRLISKINKNWKQARKRMKKSEELSN